MKSMTLYAVGLDVHKRTISYCARAADGTIHSEGSLPASRAALDSWIAQLPTPCLIGLEATMFTSWIYDHLRHRQLLVKVAHPAMLKAIAAGKKKNDRVDARTLADLLRCDYFPECRLASREIRDRRRVLRYRTLVVRQMVQMKNRVACLLMETGIAYNTQKLHQRGYFGELVEQQRGEMPECLPELLTLSRTTIESLAQIDRHLLALLEKDQLLADRVTRLRTIPGVGIVLALTWALEIGEVQRFASIKEAISYCGLCAGEKSSGGKSARLPLSKQRNEHLQYVLVEAAKVAPRWSPELALVYERAKEKGHRNSATLAVARKLVAHLIAVDRRQHGFALNPPPRAEKTPTVPTLQ